MYSTRVCVTRVVTTVFALYNDFFDKVQSINIMDKSINHIGLIIYAKNSYVLDVYFSLPLTSGHAVARDRTNAVMVTKEFITA